MIVSALPLVAASALAATPEDNLGKYAALRLRVDTDFVRHGLASGAGLPAHERRSDGSIRWADATIDLAWYVAVLSTELALRDDPATYPGVARAVSGVDTPRRLHEALAALERLDLDGDAAFDAPCSQTPALNGFFIRDDVPADQHLSFPGRSATSSDYLSAVDTLKEMSQDQAWHVLMGLRTAQGLLPAGTTVDGRDLGAWATQLGTRIADHLASDPLWTIRNPACGDRSVDRGPDAISYATGAIALVEALSGGAWTAPSPIGADLLWDLGRLPGNPAFLNPDNRHMAMAVAAGGDGWGPDTAQLLLEHADVHKWTAYPLLHAALFRPAGFCDTAPLVNASARLWLDELPAGEVPASPLPAVASHGWTVSNRFVRPSDQHYVGAPGTEGSEFHGLDYMLLHNLYALATPEAWLGADVPGWCGEAGTGDTGGPPGDSADTGAPPIDDAPGSPPQASETKPADPDRPAGGCGCAPTAPSAPIGIAWLSAALLGRRRGPSARR